MAAASESKRQNLMRKELAWLRPAHPRAPRSRSSASRRRTSSSRTNRPFATPSSSAGSRCPGSARTSSTCYGRDGRPIPVADAGAPATKTVLHELEWRIAPGERTGILGVNGAGKSTLLGLVTGAVQPTTGRVKRGKTVKIATLSQELAELTEWAEQRVSAVVAEQRTSYAIGEGSKAVELTPGQLLERLGFTNAQLSTPVKNLSGGRKRRLQLLLILLQEPNVLILDEPTNDLDTDMLAAIEDLLDSWPGTLLVVSPRPLPHRAGHRSAARDHRRAPSRPPRGVEQYLELRRGVDARERHAAEASRPIAAGGAATRRTLRRRRGLRARAARAPQPRHSPRRRRSPHRREGAQLDRPQARTAAGRDRAQHEKLARHDQSDYVGLGALGDELARLETSVAELETRWLEVSETSKAERARRDRADRTKHRPTSQKL